MKLPKGLGLEGLEGLQYRPPPPPASLPPVAIVEVVEEEEGTDYGDEEGDTRDEIIEVVQSKAPRRVRESERGERSTRYHDSNASIQQRSYYRPPPPLPSQVKPRPSTTIVRAEPARRGASTATAGPIAHVFTTRHIGSGPVDAASARAALERGIRERKLERFGREERGWGEQKGFRDEREVGYAAHHRAAGREVARMGSGSRAMREAITPLVM